MHSWRVLILPFLEQSPLYERYNFGEPWDSPGNRALFDDCPDVFRMHGERNTNRHFTNYLAVTGDDTLWPRDKTLRQDDIPDGPDNTILMVENRSAEIIWSEPRDLDIDTMTLSVGQDPVNGISSWKNPPAVVFADYSTHRLPLHLSEDSVRALLLRSDGSGDATIAPALPDGRDRPDVAADSEADELGADETGSEQSGREQSEAESIPEAASPAHREPAF